MTLILVKLDELAAHRVNDGDAGDLLAGHIGVLFQRPVLDHVRRAGAFDAVRLLHLRDVNGNHVVAVEVGHQHMFAVLSEHHVVVVHLPDGDFPLQPEVSRIKELDLLFILHAHGHRSAIGAECNAIGTRPHREPADLLHGLQVYQRD